MWTSEDVEQRHGGLDPLSKRKWLAVANNALTATDDVRGSARLADASVREGGLVTTEVREGDALGTERARRHGHRGYAVMEGCGDCIRVEMIERSIADRYTPAEFREKDGEHFYGAWRGGPASAGGGPASVKGRGTKEERTKELAAKVGASNVGNTDNLKGVKSEGQKDSTKAALHPAIAKEYDRLANAPGTHPDLALGYMKAKAADEAVAAKRRQVAAEASKMDPKTGRPGTDDPAGRKAYDDAKAKAEASNTRLQAQKKAEAEGQAPNGRPGPNDPAGRKAFDEGKAKAEATSAARSPQENARLAQKPSPKPNSYEGELAAAKAKYPGMSQSEAYSQWQLDRTNARNNAAEKTAAKPAAKPEPTRQARTGPDPKTGRPGADDPAGRKAYDDARAKAEASNPRLQAQKKAEAAGQDPVTGRPGPGDPAGRKAFDDARAKAGAGSTKTLAQQKQARLDAEKAATNAKAQYGIGQNLNNPSKGGALADARLAAKPGAMKAGTPEQMATAANGSQLRLMSTSSNPAQAAAATKRMTGGSESFNSQNLAKMSRSNVEHVAINHPDAAVRSAARQDLMRRETASSLRADLLQARADLRTARRVREADIAEKGSGDHFYGAWKGGSAKSGGGPSGGADGNPRTSKAEEAKAGAAKQGGSYASKADYEAKYGKDGQPTLADLYKQKHGRSMDDDLKALDARDAAAAAAAKPKTLSQMYDEKHGITGNTLADKKASFDAQVNASHEARRVAVGLPAKETASETAARLDHEFLRSPLAFTLTPSQRAEVEKSAARYQATADKLAKARR
jgi:hypothetical protein